jgi:hypothetical protein
MAFINAMPDRNAENHHPDFPPAMTLRVNFPARLIG